MIRINLLKNTAGEKGGGAAVDASTSVDDRPDRAFAVEYLATEGDNRDTIIKAALFLLPTILYFVYRIHVASAAQEQYHTLQTKSQEIQTRLKELEPAIKEMERFQEEKRKLGSQLETIKNLSKERLKNVKCLDAVQSLIPQKAWLTSLKISENKAEFEGMATDDIVISDFMSALEASIYFAGVVLVSSEEAKKDIGVVKKFSIKANLENF